VPDVDLRCPSCGALVSADADWCGQCFSSLRPAPEPETRAPAADTVTRVGPCSVCGAENPIDLDVCSVCGTPFAHVMRSEPARPRIDPRDAVIRSLIFPGLGHRAVGRPVDGVARGVLFAVTFGLGVLLAVAAAGSGALVGAFVLFIVAGVAVYVMSAMEAHRLASGGSLLVPTNVLMWTIVGVVFVGVALLVLGAVTATHR
jgi:ribosomal protein L40E